MTEPASLPERIQVMLERWRREAAMEHRVSFCADDLEALLAEYAVSKTSGQCSQCGAPTLKPGQRHAVMNMVPRKRPAFHLGDDDFEEQTR